MAEARFILIRHAESAWNAAGRWQGHADPDLSAHGRAQAETLAKALARESVDVLLTSDLRRAVQTAQAIARQLGLQPRRDPRLRELDVGEWAGLRREEIEGRAPALLARFEAGDPDARPGGGETRGEIRARVRGAFAEIARGHPGRCVAVVTHLGVIRALLPGTELENAEFRRVAASGLAPPA